MHVAAKGFDVASLFGKVKLGVALVMQAIVRPRTALFALRERGLAHVLRRFVGSDSASIETMARDLRFRSLPATLDNLQAYYSDVGLEATDDPDHYLVRLPSDERFFIRRSRGWNDLGTLHDTFVKQIYASHPPVAGKTVLDVGANIGDTAIYFAKLGARVIAYEPDPDMCALARRNAALNGLSIEFHNAGVGAANETLPLSSSVHGADSMSVTLFAGNEPINRMHGTTLPVRIVAFSEALAPFASVDLVKMDCEGCEYPALLSLPDDGLRAVAHIIMEYHGRGDELAEKLQRCGFSLRREGAMYMYADRVTDEGASSGRPE